MDSKKYAARFTIQFSCADPAHLQVVDILNRQAPRSKAQYIVNAILHYENCNTIPQSAITTTITEEFIEVVVRRMLEQSRQDKSQSLIFENSSQDEVLSESTCLNDAVSALGQDGLDAIAGAIDAFRC
jgi:hypothetical protein